MNWEHGVHGLAENYNGFGTPPSSVLKPQKSTRQFYYLPRAALHFDCSKGTMQLLQKLQGLGLVLPP